MRRTWTVPPRFSPLRSLLGLAICRLVKEKRQAEGTFLIVLPSLVLLVVLAQFIAWTWIEPTISEAGSNAEAARFFLAQAIGALALLLLCAVGFTPGIRVSVTESSLTAQQGRRTCTVAFADIRDVRVVTGLHYHRVVRLQRSTEEYRSRLTPDVLLVETASRVLALALRPPGVQDLDKHLQEVGNASPSAAQYP